MVNLYNGILHSCLKNGVNIYSLITLIMERSSVYILKWRKKLQNSILCIRMEWETLIYFYQYMCINLFACICKNTKKTKIWEWGLIQIYLTQFWVCKHRKLLHFKSENKLKERTRISSKD